MIQLIKIEWLSRRLQNISLITCSTFICMYFIQCVIYLFIFILYFLIHLYSLNLLCMLVILSPTVVKWIVISLCSKWKIIVNLFRQHFVFMELLFFFKFYLFFGVFKRQDRKFGRLSYYLIVNFYELSLILLLGLFIIFLTVLCFCRYKFIICSFILHIDILLLHQQTIWITKAVKGIVLV